MDTTPALPTPRRLASLGAALLLGWPLPTDAAPAYAAFPATPEKLRILHYTFTGPGASRHVQAMDAAEKALKDLAAARNWESYRTEDPAYFTDANLAPYHVLFFDNVCCASIFSTASQRQAVERFLRSGKGYVGSHAATASEPGWAFWVGLHGGVVNNGHPAPDTGTAVVEYRDHPATAGLPARWNLGMNEWFQYNRNLRDNKKAKVLVSLPKGSVIAGHVFQEDLPVSWCNYHEGARAFYSSLGHFATAFTDARQRDHFLGALEWAGGRTPRNGACGEPVSTGLLRGSGGPRPFAARLFAARASSGAVEVRILEPGSHLLELFDARGIRIASARGTRGIFGLPSGGPGIRHLKVTSGPHVYQETLAVAR